MENEMRHLLQGMHALCTQALPKFNWGASFLDADAIRLLNEVPSLVAKTLQRDEAYAYFGAGLDASKVEGDILPPIGSKVRVFLASSGPSVQRVIGYYVWPPLEGRVGYRIFVRVVNEDGFENARDLNDVEMV